MILQIVYVDSPVRHARPENAEAAIPDLKDVAHSVRATREIERDFHAEKRRSDICHPDAACAARSERQRELGSGRHWAVMKT